MLPEVQRVTVSYDDVDEVQTVTTSQVCCSLWRKVREDEIGYCAHGFLQG